MANNVLPDIVDVNVVSPDPLNVNVVSPDPLPVDIVSPLEVSDRGSVGLPVFLQDQTTDMIDLLFLQEKTSGLLLSLDTVIGQRTIDMVAGHGLTTSNSAGHVLEIAETGTTNYYQGKVITVTGDTVLLSPPISRIFTTTGSTVGTSNSNMAQDDATGVAIDGSVTPVIFSIKPTLSQSGDITRVILATTSTNDSDLTTFGGANALIAGLTLRAKKSDGSFKNIYTYRNNFDIAIHGFDTAVFSPKLGNSTKGLLARVTFAGQSKHGVAVRLDGSLGEELQVIISELMDNTASGNISVSFIAEGSELQGE